mmetsp:Transcript_21967/g.52050  ORF Transcript_21967/g.52050 Transcript_21967/m.52050 type:complete len:118 (-) Transcript_21967:917-1270(-)
MVAFDAVESAVPLLLDAETVDEATLEAAFIVVDEAEDPEIAGNPEATDAALVDTERTCGIVGGVGTREAVEFLTGSSYEGGGKMGLDDAFPVPDGPPPPVLLRGVVPAAPLAALKAC